MYRAQQRVIHGTILLLLWLSCLIHITSSLSVERHNSENADRSHVPKLLWPLNCSPPDALCPDIMYTAWKDDTGNADSWDCNLAAYKGHTGNDFQIRGWNAMAQGVDVLAAHDGKVVLAVDGTYDKCGHQDSYDIDECTIQNKYTECLQEGQIRRCFAAGNVLVLKNENSNFMSFWGTAYFHLKKLSLLVKEGDTIVAGQKIAQVGSAGRSTGPHLHFEVLAGLRSPIDPFGGRCSDRMEDMWKYSPPWSSTT